MAKKNENFSLLLKGCDAKIRCPIFLFHCGTAPPPPKWVRFSSLSRLHD